MENFLESNLFAYVVLPLAIFVARIIDVSIGTIRIILVAKGQKYMAPILGFFEVFVWLLAIGVIMQNLDNWVTFLAFCGGYAAGNYVGIIIEERLAMGNVVLQVITKKKAGDLIRILKARKYRLTHIAAKGNDGEVSVIYIITKRKGIDELIGRIKKKHPKAFFSIEDVRFMSDGVLPMQQKASRRNRQNFLKISRQGK